MSATFLKLTREQLNIITGGDPRAIKAFEDFMAIVNALGTHAATHEPGGSDPLAVDAAAAIGSLRTLGTGAQKAAAGIHAATHVTGGGDTIADAVAAGNSGLLSGADKTKLDSIAWTLYHFPLDNTNNKQAVNAAAPPASGAWSAAVDCSGLVPAGAKAILADVEVKSASGAGSIHAQLFLAFSDNNANTPAITTAHPKARNEGFVNAPGQDNWASSEQTIPVSAARTFYTYCIANAGGGTFTYSVTIKGYYV